MAQTADPGGVDSDPDPTVRTKITGSGSTTLVVGKRVADLDPVKNISELVHVFFFFFSRSFLDTANLNPDPKLIQYTDHTYMMRPFGSGSLLG